MSESMIKPAAKIGSSKAQKKSREGTVEHHLRAIATLVLGDHADLELSVEERARVVDFFIDCYSVTAEHVLAELVETSLAVVVEASDDEDDEEDDDDEDEDEDEDDDEDDEEDDDDGDEDEDDEDEDDEDEDAEEEEDDDSPRRRASLDH